MTDALPVPVEHLLRVEHLVWSSTSCGRAPLVGRVARERSEQAYRDRRPRYPHGVCPQKGAGDTATWLPKSKSFRCTYVSHQVSVKAAYRLWVTKAEHEAMTRVLSSCADAPTVVVAPVPVLIVVAAPAPAPEAAPVSPGCDPNYFGACVPIASDVDCAGGSGNGPEYVRGPVTIVGDDIYGLDRDGDRIAC